jgi:hypothetical protein
VIRVSTVPARSEAANRRLAQIMLRSCTSGASHYYCFDFAERLRTGNGIAADGKLAAAMEAQGKVLHAVDAYDACRAESVNACSVEV